VRPIKHKIVTVITYLYKECENMASVHSCVQMSFERINGAIEIWMNNNANISNFTFVPSKLISSVPLRRRHNADVQTCKGNGH
jgi:hypothetical protein